MGSSPTTRTHELGVQAAIDALDREYPLYYRSLSGWHEVDNRHIVEYILDVYQGVL